jgi:hypothetical protein
LRDGVPEFVDRAGGNALEEGLELGEGLLDGIESAPAFSMALRTAVGLIT